MIELVDGAIYSIEEENLSQEMLEELCASGHENDVICVIGEDGNKIYINAEDIKKERIDERCYAVAGENVFLQLRSNPHIDGAVPILDPEGNPIAMAKYCISSYRHNYDCDIQRIDTSVFDLYECVCLCGVNEFSVLLYQQCFHNYKGKIALFGKDWKAMLPYLGKGPKNTDVFVTTDGPEWEQELKNKKIMSLGAFTSNVAEYLKRCKMGLFSYDEIMTLVYYFTQHQIVSENSNRKVFVIDVCCGGLGLVAMVNGFEIPCAYLAAKGYIPIINIVSAVGSIYSDGPGDDIWCKFFRQPSGICRDDLKDVGDVTISPLTPVSNPGRWLMQQMTGCGAMNLLNPELFNDRLLEHIDGYRKRILQEPEKTLGVLIRGTDYVAVQPKGHSVQATPEQVIEKIKELPKEEWNFENIFVATEDAEALRKMQSAFGDKVKYVDQKRFVSQKGEYLSEQREKDTWKPGEGWKYGADYLCAMVLLSECRFFLASGRCSGVGLVEKLAEDRHSQSYVFDLGVY
ncbi:O-fucosyltransferase family protein [Parablautia muri]|uniref:Uncharacterized protein n=1 Tax=Parablautia muri TaxID=2320879 RepID=A0A9X5BFI1_9FIRM|nr:hypothetical protein [Parablautia muri]NBJ92853.1 hypothetical protein [Parablautia muri]